MAGMTDFSGKAVLITGGATGIGRATAQAFAAAGANVMIGDIDPRAEETVQLIQNRSGHNHSGTAAWMKADVRDADAMTALVAACVDRFGRMDAAFNNAGILAPQRPLHEIPAAEWEHTIDVDLKGVFFAMQAEIRHFLKAGGGAIVNTASVGGLIADPGMAPYIAAKHGVVGLTKAAAVDYGRLGIRVNAIAPGFVVTPMTQHWADSQAFTDMFFANNVSGRASQPEEMAATVLHLCSDGASFINGATFTIDGGQTAH